MLHKPQIQTCFFQNGEDENNSLEIRGSKSGVLSRGKKLTYKNELNVEQNNNNRGGRSVVHKNLEDNYGAVISANHEALAQLLEQVRVV